MEVLLVLLIIGVAFFIYVVRSKMHWLTAFSLIFHFLAFLVFGFMLLLHSNQHTQAIDILDEGYIPFGGKHIVTLIVFYMLYISSKYGLWKYHKKLPPLTWVLCNAIIGIGIVINFIIVLQLSKNDKSWENDLFLDNASFEFSPFLIYPIITSISAVYLMIKSGLYIGERFKNYQYQHPFLKTVHSLVLKVNHYPIVVLLSMFPVFLVLTGILLVFGQDYDSMVKVFTDTTTWRFSQQSHPPYLDHQGHYLCTVAAVGHPKIVKPLRLGNRHGHTIIVNRQLMIANAFEALLEQYIPKTHHYIRFIYDHYGYNLSKRINSSQASTITYVLMKPLEWLFLIVLYLCCTKPEELIKRQYAHD